jgi:hypothetical protein
LGTPWIVECVSELFISIPQESNDVEVALMMAPRGIEAKGLEVFNDALAESLKGDLPELAEGLPV